MKVLKGFIKSVLILVVLFCIAFYMVERLFPLKYYEQALSASKKYGVNVLLIEAIMKAESNFDKNATSVKEAKGLMQVTDDTAVWCARNMKIAKYDLYDESDNINIGTYYFKYLLDKYDGDVILASAAYNAGHGNVDKWINENGYDEKNKKLHIPYKETQRYVRKIALYERIYSLIYKDVLGVERISESSFERISHSS